MNGMSIEVGKQDAGLPIIRVRRIEIGARCVFFFASCCLYRI